MVVVDTSSETIFPTLIRESTMHGQYAFAENILELFTGLLVSYT
jgi:hypothetical protein